MEITGKVDIFRENSLVEEKDKENRQLADKRKNSKLLPDSSRRCRYLTP